MSNGETENRASARIIVGSQSASIRFNDGPAHGQI
jgi:hypothetical protein